MSARADVQKIAEGRFRVELTTLVEGTRGRRVIEERSCMAMADATVLILAWMVDPGQTGGEQAPAPRPLPSSPPARSTRPTRDKAPPAAGGALQLEAGALALFDAGTLPAPAFGLGPAAGLRWRSFRAHARAGLWAVQTKELEAKAGSGASFRLLNLGLEVCAAPIDFDAAACAGAELDRLQGTGFGVDRPRTDAGWWLALTFGPDARFALIGPLGITVGAQVVVPTRRERFGLDGIGIVHRPAKIAGRLGAGLELLF